jgi:hypothetical protein
MFDSVTIRQGPERVVVTEQRAPTDDSILLAEEMRRHIIEKVVSAIPVADNAFRGKIVKVFDGMGENYRAVFMLNGQRFEVAMPDGPAQAAMGKREFFEAVARAIAVELLKGSER